MHKAKISDAEDDLEGSTQPARSKRTWTFVLDAFIRPLLNYEVFKSVHETVARAVQEPGEEEGSFSDRLSKAAII